MSDYPMLISNKLHSFRNFMPQRYNIFVDKVSPEPRDCWFESKAPLVLNPKDIGLKGRSGRFRTNGIMPTEGCRRDGNVIES